MDDYGSHQSEQTTVSYWVSYTYKGSAATLTTYATVTKDPSKAHYVSLNDELAPFWARNKDVVLQPCGYGYDAATSLPRGFSKLTDDMLVTRYLLIKPTCNYGDDTYYNN
jgi:hypothetical protein